MAKKDMTIVIPAYNEETRLPPTLQTILSWAESTDVFDVQVVVVDDGSEDRTCEIVREVMKQTSRVKLIEENHVGAMHAVFSGFNSVTTPLVGNMDADCSVHPSEFEKIINYVDDNSVAQGSRILRGDLPQVEGKSFFRNFISSAMSRLFITLFSCGIRDPQIGFRLYTKVGLDRIIPTMRLRHDGLKIAEIVVRAYGLGMKVTELPVPYVHDDDSRCVPKSPIKVIGVLIGSIIGVFQIWFQCGIDYHKGILSRKPVRGVAFLALLAFFSRS